MLKKFLAEMIGTFILVFVGTGAVVLGNGIEGIGHLGIALSFSFAVVAAAYSVGPISGAHLNPAVSLAMLINKRLTWIEWGIYVTAQLLGALLASSSLRFFLINSGLPTTSLGENRFLIINTAGAFFFELVTTFILVLVIMTVTSSSKGNSKIAGLVIGLTLISLILLGLNVTGPSANPARSLAPALFVGGEALKQVWVFILAPLVGASLAAITSKYVLGTEE